MPATMDAELHWKRCKTAREMYLQSGAQLWIEMGRQAGCPWTVALSGPQLGAVEATLETPRHVAPLIVAATAFLFSGIAYAVGR